MTDPAAASHPRSDDARRIESLEQALKQAHDGAVDPASIRPVILPFALSSAFPSYKLPGAELYVLWVSSSPSAVAGYTNEIYINQQQASWLEEHGYSLPKLALLNIAQLTGDAWDSHRNEEDDGTVTSLGFLHDDGYGPARLLFRQYYRDCFPDGYWVAIPNRNTALAFSKSLSAEELAGAQELVQSCYEEGEGVCDQLFEPSAIAVPAPWFEDATRWLEQHTGSA